MTDPTPQKSTSPPRLTLKRTRSDRPRPAGSPIEPLQTVPSYAPLTLTLLGGTLHGH